MKNLKISRKRKEQKTNSIFILDISFAISFTYVTEEPLIKGSMYVADVANGSVHDKGW